MGMLHWPLKSPRWCKRSAHTHTSLTEAFSLAYGAHLALYHVQRCSELRMFFSDWLPNPVVSCLPLGSSARWPRVPRALPVSRHSGWPSSSCVGWGDQLKPEVSGSEHNVSQSPRCLPWAQQTWAGEAKVMDSHEAARRDRWAEWMSPDPDSLSYPHKS